MLNKKQNLHRDIFEPSNLQHKGTRDGLGSGLLKLGAKNKNVVVLTADLMESTRVNGFADKFPERFVEVGVAEQNMATVAAGLALTQKIPYMTSFSAFSPGRNMEQIRTNIALQNLPVKIASTHAGLTVGPDGATHQALDDIAFIRVEPNMTVVVPADALEAEKATIAASKVDGPVYLRYGRPKVPVFTTRHTPFTIGKADVLTSGKNVTVVACGHLVYEALLAAKELKKQNIHVEVINCHTVKPLDVKTILKSVRKTRCLVTAEEHQIAGGLGSAVLEGLCNKYPVPTEMVGVKDQFGQSGEATQLMKKYGLDSSGIIRAIKRVLKLK
jgi:transketolase